MTTVTLKAHFDGQHIVLDEPFELPKDAQLAVTILTSPLSELDAEREAWTAFALQQLARAYGDDEPEYTLDDIKS